MYRGGALPKTCAFFKNAQPANAINPVLSYVAYLPVLFIIYVAKNYSVQQAFIWVYLPTLLLLPDYYQAVTIGLPDPSFNQSASVALFFFFFKSNYRGYRFSYLDVVVGFYAFIMSYSEFLASGYSDAQNLMFFELTSVFFPYLFAKSLIEPFKLRYDFAKVITLCLCIVAVLNVYENVFSNNLWQMIVGRFFNGQGYEWETTHRFGIARASGPYAHCLIDGIMMAVGYRLVRWLQWSQAWPEKIKLLKWLPKFIKPAVFFSVMVFGGVITTLGKGQWLAGIVAASIVIIGRSEKRVMAIVGVFAALIFIGIPALIAFIDYASVGQENAKDFNQETAAYRYELISEYGTLVLERPWFGWGGGKWPKNPFFPSIDNHFLLISLDHGIIALGLLVYLIFGIMTRLIKHGMRQPVAKPAGSSFAFTLAAILLMYCVAIATVAMMYQSCTMFFIIIGLADAYLRTSSIYGDAPLNTPTLQKSVDNRLFKFRRVL